MLGLRRRLLSNRLADWSGRRWRVALSTFVGGAVLLLIAGHLAAPALMEPPVDLATPRGLAADELPAGAAALEAAFWLTALIAAVLNFRVLELLFRRPDVVALQQLPIDADALFVDRFLATCIEATVAAAGASLFFVPLIWHGGASAAVASAAMLFGGLLFGTAISLVVMILATRQLIPDDGGDTDRRPMLSDAYGGPGQLLLYAPAVALGGVVVIALFWKLLVGEPLRLGHTSEPFWIGTSIVVATCVACLVVARRAFVEAYYAMAPRFHEADAADFSAVVDYQESSFGDARRWEWGLSTPTARTYRALVIDDDRRMAGRRVGYAVVVALAVVGLAVVELDALPSWAAAMLPAALIGIIVNPWHRIADRARRIDVPMALPVAGIARQRASTRIAIREYLFVALPAGSAAAVILGYFRGLAVDGVLIGVGSIAVGFGIAGAVSLVSRLGIDRRALRWLPAAVVFGLTASAVVSLVAAITVSIVVAAAAFVISYLARSSHAD